MVVELSMEFFEDFSEDMLWLALTTRIRMVGREMTMTPRQVWITDHHIAGAHLYDVSGLPRLSAEPASRIMANAQSLFTDLVLTPAGILSSLR